MDHQKISRISTDIDIDDNYLEFYRLDNQVVNDAYDRLAAYINLRKDTDSISSFTITGCEPKAGVTTIAVNLAITMASAGWKTILINADLKKERDIGNQKLKNKFGLSQYLSGYVPIDKIINSTKWENLCFISNGKTGYNSVELLYSEYMDSLISRLKEKFDIIIIDAPSINAVVDASIIASKTDTTILIAKQKSTKTAYIKSAKRELDHVGANIMGIVMNHVDKNVYRNYLKYYNYLKRISFGKIKPSPYK